MCQAGRLDGQNHAIRPDRDSSRGKRRWYAMGIFLCPAAALKSGPKNHFVPDKSKSQRYRMEPRLRVEQHKSRSGYKDSRRRFDVSQIRSERPLFWPLCRGSRNLYVEQPCHLTGTVAVCRTLSWIFVTRRRAGRSGNGYLGVPDRLPADRFSTTIDSCCRIYRGPFEMSGVKRPFAPESKAEVGQRKMPLA